MVSVFIPTKPWKVLMYIISIIVICLALIDGGRSQSNQPSTADPTTTLPPLAFNTTTDHHEQTPSNATLPNWLIVILLIGCICLISGSSLCFVGYKHKQELGQLNEHIAKDSVAQYATLLDISHMFDTLMSDEEV